MKRYCQTLELYNDSELIRAYVAAHQHVWPEIKAGIREVGILDMQIYIHEHTLFMIVDTVDEFDWIKITSAWLNFPGRQNGRLICLAFSVHCPDKRHMRSGK